MVKLRLIILFSAILLVFGCVSTAKYKDRLTDIDNLKKDVSSMESRLKQEEDELTKLRNENDDLKKQNQALLEDNKGLNEILKSKADALNKTIVELRAKLANRDVDVTSLRNNIDVLLREKAAAIAEKEKSIAEVKKTYDSLVGEMQEEIKKGDVTITQLRDKLTLSMVEKVLFDSGSAAIKKNGKKVLDRVAEILKKVPDKQIRIEGYTDNVPIGSGLEAKFPTNWELSTSRATTVVRYLQNDGIDPERLSACGYSEYRPVASNNTDEGKAKNRRIEIVLTSGEFVKIPAEMPKDAD
ncbi:MAG TPA: OmpA family protein [Nitrospirota bacterium]|nr:OmpA family protein [Nitrospirota bacterium]